MKSKYFKKFISGVVFSKRQVTSVREKIDLKHLKFGTYFISISSDEGLSTSTIVISR